MAKLILFDIDGTLVLSGGAGLRSLNRAFEAECQLEGAFEHVALPGRTDRAILADVLSRLNIAFDKRDETSFRARYSQFLLDEIARPHPLKRVLPGVTALLDALAGAGDSTLALLTGNYPEAARIKLEYFGLWHHFGFGAFGDDAIHRNDLLDVALQRARESGLEPFAPADIMVVGDTPLDVACAKAGGAKAVAVATGEFDAEALRSAGADVVLENLRDVDAFQALMA